MILSPADLTYFVEIAQTLNVSRAAERLGISQPSLSLAIQRMEHAVGTALLVRSKRGVSLTQAGRQLLAHSKSLLQAWEHVRAGALASVNDIQGSFTIGCHPSVALSALPGFMPKLMAQYPKLDISLRHDLSRKIAEEVISMKVDLGIVVNPVQHPDLIIHPLCRDEVTLWTARAKTSSVLICDPDLAQSQSLMKQFKKSGFVFERIVPSGSLEVIADLVAKGTGVGILPAKVAARARGKLKRVPGAPVHYDDHSLIFRVENKGVKAIQAINNAIKASYGRAA